MLRMWWKCQNRREIYVYEERPCSFWLFSFFQEKGDIRWTERKLEGPLSAFGQWAWSLVEHTLDSEHIRRVKGADKTKIQRHREGCGWNYKAHLRTFITPKFADIPFMASLLIYSVRWKLRLLRSTKCTSWFYFNSKLLHDLRPILFSIIFLWHIPTSKRSRLLVSATWFTPYGISLVY